MKRSILFAAVLLALAGFAPAVIIDRIAVSVGNRVITESDLVREIRVAAFLNGVEPDLGGTAKRTAAERMVEQKLIRGELESSRYPLPSAAEVDPILAKFKQEHYPAAGDYDRELARRQISDRDVRDELLWQRTLLRFIEIRFRPGVQVSDQEIQDYFASVVEPAAHTAHPDQPVALEDYRDQIEETLAGERTDQQVDTWLREARRQAEIVFHSEVFQ